MSVVYLNRDPPLPRRGFPLGPAINLDVTTPTLLVERLLEASLDATSKAGDPLNLLDDNPYIGREWLIVSRAFWKAAREMEQDFTTLFDGGRPSEMLPWPAPRLAGVTGDTAPAAGSDEIARLRREATALKKAVAELTVENRQLKEGAIGAREDSA